jgi:hypothetical protein
MTLLRCASLDTAVPKRPLVWTWSVMVVISFII